MHILPLKIHLIWNVLSLKKKMHIGHKCYSELVLKSYKELLEAALGADFHPWPPNSRRLAASCRSPAGQQPGKGVPSCAQPLPLTAARALGEAQLLTNQRSPATKTNDTYCCHIQTTVPLLDIHRIVLITKSLRRLQAATIWITSMKCLQHPCFMQLCLRPTWAQR